MALIPPTSRVFDQHCKSLRDCWLSLALGLFLMAFLGLVVDTVREVRLRGGAVATQNSSDVPHLSKRDPARLMSAEARRDGTASTPLDSSGGLLPRPTTMSGARCGRPIAGAWCASRGPSGAIAASFQPRAPPLTA
ncbi:hypothetical protein [Pseudorhizobium pelagicum]|uniref:hypothetical protein n=1 Tax=Pseudorhizobium pelagicum TaxID=1509405 RepID=UPI000AEC2513|nr:hypothetical protein [Pseudorhizobium pelagicum]